MYPIEIPDGTHLERYENGGRREEVDYRNGWKDGHCLTWHWNQQMESAGEFVHGKRDGPWMRWHDNGVKRWEGRYRNGKMIGTVNVWYENGALEQVDSYSDEGEIRSATFWHENGRLQCKGEYVGGWPSGRWEHFNEDGTQDTEESGLYFEGKKIRD
jgi:antitoxin component YwqK of YwqJK toxin-antitoxin module